MRCAAYAPSFQTCRSFCDRLLGHSSLIECYAMVRFLKLGQAARLIRLRALRAWRMHSSDWTKLSTRSWLPAMSARRVIRRSGVRCSASLHSTIMLDFRNATRGTTRCSSDKACNQPPNKRLKLAARVGFEMTLFFQPAEVKAQPVRKPETLYSS